MMDSLVEQKLRQVQLLDRDGCMSELLSIPKPKLDFTRDCLSQMSLERLRHILMAAHLQACKSAKQQH